jgi:hypothetical protein
VVLESRISWIVRFLRSGGGTGGGTANLDRKPDRHLIYQ